MNKCTDLIGSGLLWSDLDLVWYVMVWFEYLSISYLAIHPSKLDWIGLDPSLLFSSLLFPVRNENCHICMSVYCGLANWLIHAFTHSAGTR